MDRVIAFAVVASCACLMVSAHVFKTGNCPNVDVMESFDYDKFQGTWFAIEKSNTLSSCMSYNFLTKSDASKIVEEKYRFFGVRILDLTDFSQIGQLSTPDEAVQAKMLVQFPFSMNPFSPASFWVMSTDYDGYAAIWSCRRFLFGHFQSALILSRNQTLDRQTLNKLRSRFEFYGVDKSDLSVVDQSDCPRTTKPDGDVTTTTVQSEGGVFVASDVTVSTAAPSTTTTTTTSAPTSTGSDVETTVDDNDNNEVNIV